MSKTKIAILSAAIVTTVSAVAFVFSILGSETALFERFPDIDPKIVVKAHRQMIKETLQGKHSGSNMTDEENDKIFLDIVQKLTNK